MKKHHFHTCPQCGAVTECLRRESCNLIGCMVPCIGHRDVVVAKAKVEQTYRAVKEEK